MKRVVETIVGSSARRAKSLALAAGARLGRYRDVVWLIGDGRSGTTWVSSLINHEQRYREMFEPFHPRVLDDSIGFRPNQYIRADDPHELFHAVAAEVFSGRLTHPRVDADARPALYNGLLVKDIFANLFACWASRRFPHVRILLLIRNPFAVAVSKRHKHRWLWTVDPLDLLKQRHLYDDYLRPFEDVIRGTAAANDFIHNQVLIWSILNYVPLRQFLPDRLHVVFYEDVCARPHDEVSRIVRHIRRNEDEARVTVPDDVLRTPSRVTSATSALLAGASPVDSWRREVTPAQIDGGLAILRHFGLDGLYPDGSMPVRERLEAVRAG